MKMSGQKRSQSGGSLFMKELLVLLLWVHLPPQLGCMELLLESWHHYFVA
jgi:hypothetical protein